MSRKLILLGVLTLFFAPGAALSLGLGEIRLNSYLNQPMSAEIALSVSSATELESLNVQLAPLEAFQRYGLDRPAYFDDLRFRVSRTGPTSAVVEVSSSRPIVEPFVTFLLEARWSGGRILREYTLLLDPPTFLPRPEPAPVPVVDTPPPVTEQPVARPAPTPPPVAAPRALRSDYRVQRNDTLWGIARQVSADDSLTTNQVMVALFRENPQAFDGNINRLRAGTVLRIPSREAIAATSAGAASAEVRRQTQAWRDAQPAPPTERRLELAPPTEAPRPPAPAVQPGVAPPPDTVMEAVQELRGELAETRRLVELRDAEIAALQSRLAELEAGPPVTAPDPVAPVERPPVEPPPVTEEVAPEPEEPAPLPAPAPAPVPEAVAPAPEPAPAPSMLDRALALLGNLWVWLVLAVALIAGAVAVALRRRKDDERSIEDELAETGTWGAIEPTGAQLGAGAAAAAATAQVTPREPADQPGTIHVEEAERPVLVEEPPLPPPDESSAEEDYHYPFEDTIAGGTGINLDQSDPLAEADFHMAYGLYDQAAEIVKKAIEREPDRYDLRRKLLDICFVWGNAEEFLAHANAVRERGGESAEADWSKICIMGRQICPGEPLFQAAPPAAVDLDLGEVDIAGSGAADTGASGTWLDFDVGESDTPLEALGDTQEQPRPGQGGVAPDATAELDLEELGIDLELGESGEYALQDLAEQAPEDERDDTLQRRAVPEEGVTDATGTGELDDAGTLVMDAFPEPEDQEAPTQRGEGFELAEDEPTLSGVIGFEEELEGTQTMLAAAIERPEDDDMTVIGAGGVPEQALEDDDDGTLIRKFDLPRDDSPTTEVGAIEEDPGLDLDDITHMLEAELGDTRAEEEVDEATLVARGFGEAAAPPEAAEGESDGDTREMPAEIDEVGTKLDLARAYIDMGDSDGARSILEEVVEEGSEAQREEARQLLDSLD